MKTFFATLAAILVAAAIIMAIKSFNDSVKEQNRITELLNQQGADLVKHSQELMREAKFAH